MDEVDSLAAGLRTLSNWVEVADSVLQINQEEARGAPTADVAHVSCPAKGATKEVSCHRIGNSAVVVGRENKGAIVVSDCNRVVRGDQSSKVDALDKGLNLTASVGHIHFFPGGFRQRWCFIATVSQKSHI